MGFGKISLTALLVVTQFFLASTVLTTKTQAQEVRLEALTKASGVSQCIKDSFVPASKNCTSFPKKVKNSEFLPTSTLIPKIELKKEEKKEEVVKTPALQFTPNPTGELSAEVLFEMVNAHRASISLPVFEKEAQVCHVAEARRQGIADEIFQGLPLHAGFYNMNLPYWATENMIYQHTEQEALSWWLNSPVHRSAIEGNYRYACGVCNGEVCNMVFTNLEPKVIAIVTPTSASAAGTPPQTLADNLKNGSTQVKSSVLAKTNSAVNSVLNQN